MLLYPAYVHLPTASTPQPRRITEDHRFNGFFKDCIGAIDGTHIHTAAVPAEAQARYRNRKGQLS